MEKLLFILGTNQSQIIHKQNDMATAELIACFHGDNVALLTSRTAEND